MTRYNLEIHVRHPSSNHLWQHRIIVTRKNIHMISFSLLLVLGQLRHVLCPLELFSRYFVLV